MLANSLLHISLPTAFYRKIPLPVKSVSLINFRQELSRMLNCIFTLSQARPR